MRFNRAQLQRFPPQQPRGWLLTNMPCWWTCKCLAAAEALSSLSLLLRPRQGTAGPQVTLTLPASTSPCHTTVPASRSSSAVLHYLGASLNSFLCTGATKKPNFDSMSVAELKAYLNTHHVSYSGLLEKSEFVAKAKATQEMLTGQ